MMSELGKRLVKRERNGQDRRIVRVVLTDRGKKANLTYQKQKKKHFGRMLSALDSQEQGELINILEKIAGAIKQDT